MRQQFSSEELSALRNRIPIQILIAETLGIPSKEIEGVFRFLCPKCREFQTAVNPKTNLSRCFRCQQNFNTIEIVMKDKQINFVQSVKFLKQLFGRGNFPILPDKIHAPTSILSTS
jgi:DNA primase